MQFLVHNFFLIILKGANVLIVVAAFLYGTPRTAIEEKHVVKVYYHQISQRYTLNKTYLGVIPI